MIEKSPFLAEFCKQNGLQHAIGVRICKTAPLRYKIFRIRKKSGAWRQVAQPAREVKAMQYFVIDKLRPHLPIHDAARAYRAGASIKENATRHAKSAFLLKMDFSDFFPSITESDLRSHLASFFNCAQLTEHDVDFICNSCLWAPERKRPLRLCVGAPSSPLISNSVMFRFDVRMSEASEDVDATYTRYADDLAFSTFRRGCLGSLEARVKEILDDLEYPRLRVNERKTVHASRAGRRIITGLTITQKGEVSIGRDRKRLIRAMFHRHLHGGLSPVEQKQLSGLLAFAEDIEPGFTQRLEKSMCDDQ